jgi:hypothetical protein
LRFRTPAWRVASPTNRKLADELRRSLSTGTNQNGVPSLTAQAAMVRANRAPGYMRRRRRDPVKSTRAGPRRSIEGNARSAPVCRSRSSRQNPPTPLQSSPATSKPTRLERQLWVSRNRIPSSSFVRFAFCQTATRNRKNASRSACHAICASLKRPKTSQWRPKRRPGVLPA